MYRILAFIVLAVGIVAADQCEDNIGLGRKFARGNHFPWYAALTDPNGRQFCGGSIIGRKHILTAAECIRGIKHEDIKVLVGTKLIRSDCGEKYDVASTTVYSDHCPETTENDISILILQKAIEIPDFVEPVELPKIDEKSVNVSDTGDYAGFMPSPHVSGVFSLMKSEATILRNHICGFYWSIQPEQICASHMLSDNNSTNKGGGLIYNDHIIGVAVHLPVNVSASPGVFTRVQPYINSITKILSDDNINPVACQSGKE